MNEPVIICFSLINLLIIDILARLLVSRNNELSKQKPAGLLALFTIALLYKGAAIFDRSLAMGRFLLSILTAIFLFAMLSMVLLKGSVLELDASKFLLLLLPLFAMPFFHLLFGLLGNRTLAILSSVRMFRLRSILSALIGTNIMLCYLGSDQLYIMVIHSFFTFLALVSLLYLCGLKRYSTEFYSINCEDTDAGPNGFFYYACSLLEFFYYCVLLEKILLMKIWVTFYPLFLDPWISMVFYPLLYLSILIFGNIFIIKRRALGLDFYERRLMPLSFLFFGIALVAKNYL